MKIPTGDEAVSEVVAQEFGIVTVVEGLASIYDLEQASVIVKMACGIVQHKQAWSVVKLNALTWIGHEGSYIVREKVQVPGWLVLEVAKMFAQVRDLVSYLTYWLQL